MNLMEVNNDKRNGEKRSELEHDWTELTWECLINIFSRLSMKERLIAVMLVCRTWMNVCKDPMLINLVFDMDSWFTPPSKPRRWLTLKFAKKVDKILMAVVERSGGHLKEIRVKHCTDRSLLYVADRCPNLEVLWVRHSKVTGKSMEKIALKCLKIKEVDISDSYEIPRECMQMLGMNCKNLQIMKLNHMVPYKASRCECCSDFYANMKQCIDSPGNYDARYIGENMPQLKHLELRNSSITEVGVVILFVTCPKLEYVDLLGCHLRSEVVRKLTSKFKNLKEVKITDELPESSEVNRRSTRVRKPNLKYQY